MPHSILTLAAPAAAMLAAFVAPALSQEAGKTITTTTGPEYDQYLVDGEGRAVYIFTADQQGQQGARTANSDCYEACAEAWPPVISPAEPQAEEAAQPDLLGRTERIGGEMQVTYNGWPLYYYVKDQGPGEATGQDVHGFGGEWYLLRPSGEKVGH